MTPFKTGKTEILVKKATLINVAGYYNKLSNEVIKILDPNGYLKINTDSYLTEFQLKQIDNLFRDELRNTQNVNWEGLKPSPRQQLRPQNRKRTEFTDETLNLVLEKNIFHSIKQNIDCPGLTSFESYFTDMEASILCSKMLSSYARNVSKLFIQENMRDEKILRRYEMHFIANKAFKAFGGKILTLIYDLPKLKFNTPNSIEVRDFKYVRPDFPLISFKTDSGISISFFTKQHNSGKELFPYVRIFRMNSFDQIEKLGEITKEGYILSKLDSFKPRISLFLNQIHDKKYEIFSGVETGVCNICKRLLNHPDSLRIGIGPICLRKLNIDLDLFQSSNLLH